MNLRPKAQSSRPLRAGKVALIDIRPLMAGYGPVIPPICLHYSGLGWVTELDHQTYFTGQDMCVCT